jgi:outer membrane lipoprotein SlyB
MKTMNRVGSVAGLMVVLALAACTTTNYPPNNVANVAVAPSGNAYSGYGVVQSVELVRQDRSGIGLGTVAGAVIGGVVGHQVGSGRGNTAATVVGAAGGAYVGHELESRQQQNADAYKVTIRMEDGAYQTLTQNTNGDFRVGDRVRIENGVLQRY